MKFWKDSHKNIANLLAAAALGGSISIWDVNFGTNANLSILLKRLELTENR